MATSKEKMRTRWERAMSTPQTKERYKEAMQGLTENPMTKAAEAVDRGDYIRGCEANQARMAQKLREVPLETLKANAVGEGANRLTTGAAKSVQKYGRGIERVDYEGSHQAAMAVPKSDPLGRVRAAMNALRRSVGKPELA